MVGAEVSVIRVTGSTTFRSWPGTVAETVASIRAGGGTNMIPALELAGRELARVDARVKHIILLTDGAANLGNVEPEVKVDVKSPVSGKIVDLMVRDGDVVWDPFVGSGAEPGDARRQVVLRRDPHVVRALEAVHEDEAQRLAPVVRSSGISFD